MHRQRDLHAGGRLQRRRQLHLQGQRRHGRTRMRPPSTSRSSRSNDRLALANIEVSALSFTEGDSATAVTSAITVSDVDNTTLDRGTVTISAGYQSGTDVLAASPPAGSLLTSTPPPAC